MPVVSLLMLEVAGRNGKPPSLQLWLAKTRCQASEAIHSEIAPRLNMDPNRRIISVSSSPTSHGRNIHFGPASTCFMCICIWMDLD
jgi:hypothetical protein